MYHACHILVLVHQSSIISKVLVDAIICKSWLSNNNDVPLRVLPPLWSNDKDFKFETMKYFLKHCNYDSTNRAYVLRLIILPNITDSALLHQFSCFLPLYTNNQ